MAKSRKTGAIEQLINGLTVMEDAFCQFYTALGEDTCQNGTKSAKKAGYKQPHNAAWKILRRPEIRQRISEIHRERMDKYMITPEGTLMKLENLRIKAEMKGDLTTAKGCVELQGKYLAMFSDRIRIDVFEEQHIEITASIEREAEKIAKMSLFGNDAAESPPSLPAAALDIPSYDVSRSDRIRDAAMTRNLSQQGDEMQDTETDDPETTDMDWLDDEQDETTQTPSRDYSDDDDFLFDDE
jgi:hypothetical protein